MALKYEDFLIGVPAIEKSVYDKLKELEEGYPFFKLNVYKGQDVEPGQLVATYNAKSFFNAHGNEGPSLKLPTIKTPISGRIEKINQIEFADWNLSAHFKKYARFTETHPEENIMFYIRPTYGQENIIGEHGKNLSLIDFYQNLTDYCFLAPHKERQGFGWRRANKEDYGTRKLPFFTDIKEKDRELNFMANSSPNIIID